MFALPWLFASWRNFPWNRSSGRGGLPRNFKPRKFRFWANQNVNCILKWVALKFQSLLRVTKLLFRNVFVVLKHRLKVFLAIWYSKVFLVDCFPLAIWKISPVVCLARRFTVHFGPSTLSGVSTNYFLCDSLNPFRVFSRKHQIGKYYRVFEFREQRNI